MTASLEGVEGAGRTFHLKAIFDRTKEVPYDEYEASLGGVPLAEFNVGKEDFLSAKMVNARVSSSVRVVVPGSAFDAGAKSTFSGFRMAFAGEPRNMLEQIIRDVLRDINEFEVTFRLWNTGGNFDMAVSTDLDTRIAERATAALGAEFTKAQNDLKSKLDDAIAGKKAEVLKLVADKTGDIQKQIGAYQSLLGDANGLADAKKKELTDLLDKQSKGKAGDLFKGLFKK